MNVQANNQDPGFDGEPNGMPNPDDHGPDDHGMEPGMGPKDMYPCSIDGPDLGVIYSGDGFAVMNDQSFKMRLDIERVNPMQPSDARRYLEHNMTLTEIKERILQVNNAPVLRGGMHLEGRVYRLDNISILQDVNKTIIWADMKGPWGRMQPPEVSPDVSINVGELNLTIDKDSEDGIATGQITLFGPPKEDYDLYLHMSAPGMGPQGPMEGQGQGPMEGRWE